MPIIGKGARSLGPPPASEALTCAGFTSFDLAMRGNEVLLKTRDTPSAAGTAADFGLAGLFLVLRLVFIERFPGEGEAPKLERLPLKSDKSSRSKSPAYNDKLEKYLQSFQNRGVCAACPLQRVTFRHPLRPERAMRSHTYIGARRNHTRISKPELTPMRWRTRPDPKVVIPE